MFKRIKPYLIFILTAGGIYYAIAFIPKLIPVGDEQVMLAQEGVSENEEWEPVIRRVEGFDMALVPAGCFEMGSTDEQLEEAFDSCDRYYGAYGCQLTFEDEQPAHEVCISEPYWIDLTAVTNWQYGSSSSLGESNSMGRDFDWPRESVTWEEASEFCETHGRRLPTEAEWEYAARGPDGLIYPFGNEYDIAKATLRKISPAPVGEKPEGASWVGGLDFSGGISEWVSDWYGPYSTETQTDPTGPESGEKRVARGGNWFAHAAFFVRTTFREALNPNYATSVMGFRCVRAFE